MLTFFEVDKVGQCLVFFLSSLIQLGGPPPGMNRLCLNVSYSKPQAHSAPRPRSARHKLAAPSKPDHDNDSTPSKFSGTRSRASSLANANVDRSTSSFGNGDQEQTLCFNAILYHKDARHHHHELYIPSHPIPRRPLKLILKRSTTTTYSKMEGLLRFDAAREARWPTKTFTSYFDNDEETLRAGTVPVLPYMRTTHHRLWTALILTSG